MAIQPIDLQTLFSQIDKVGKAQSAQREGLALQQTMQGVQIQRRTEEHIQSVNEAQNAGEGAEEVNDRSKRGKGGQGRPGGEAAAEEAAAEEKTASVIRDPSLGRNIDIST